MNFDVELFMNNNGFSIHDYQGRDKHCVDFKKVIPNFRRSGLDYIIDIYTNKLNNHVLISGEPDVELNAKTYTFFTGQIRSEDEFKQLLEMLYIK